MLATDKTGTSNGMKINTQGHQVGVTKMYKFGENILNVPSAINNESFCNRNHCKFDKIPRPSVLLSCHAPLAKIKGTLTRCVVHQHCFM